MYNSRLSIRMALVTSLYIHYKDMDKVIKEAKKAETYVLEGIVVQDTDVSFNDIISKMPFSSLALDKPNEKDTKE